MLWTLSDFVVAGGMLAALAGAGWFLVNGPQHVAYRFGVAIAVFASILVFWITGAVGIIGSEANNANLLYLGAVALALVGAAVARFRPRGMVIAFSGAATAMAAIACVAVVLGWGVEGQAWPFDVLGASAMLAALFAVSAFCFHIASRARATR